MWIKGADVSMTSETVKSGGKYYRDGKQKDLLEIMDEENYNLIRLRLWVDPYDSEGHPYGGGTNDLKKTIAMAKLIKEQGMQFMLDIHYSDFWTDPKKQILPKAWKEKSYEELKVQVYEYTKEVLEKLQANDVLPDFIQVGNEITNGFLWPHGQLPEYVNNQVVQPIARDYTKFFELLKSGIQAVRDLSESIKIILHVDYGGDKTLYDEWFDNATKFNLDYDIIGVSYYPFWHNNLETLSANLHNLSEVYKKEILVVETSYPHTTAEYPGVTSILNDELITIAGYKPTFEGQSKFICDLSEVIKSIPENRGLGYVYWEPAWIPTNTTTWATKAGQKYINDYAPEGNSWADQAIFDYHGNLLI